MLSRQPRLSPDVFLRRVAQKLPQTPTVHDLHRTLPVKSANASRELLSKRGWRQDQYSRGRITGSDRRHDRLCCVALAHSGRTEEKLPAIAGRKEALKKGRLVWRKALSVDSHLSSPDCASSRRILSHARTFLRRS